ncbi:hypothetical protein HDU86_004477 [Geranomyces michiganensis]|nr:hypothetical protein HDU86_004477 [Geranomyces michiganensis]
MRSFSVSTGAQHGSGYGSIGFLRPSPVRPVDDRARTVSVTQRTQPRYGDRKVEMPQSRRIHPAPDRPRIAGLPSHNEIRELGKAKRVTTKPQKRSVSSPALGVKATLAKLDIKGGRQVSHGPSSSKVQVSQSRSFNEIGTASAVNDDEIDDIWASFVKPRASSSPTPSPPQSRVSAIATLRPLSPDSDSGMDDFAPAATMFAAETKKVQRKAQERATSATASPIKQKSTSSHKLSSTTDTRSKPASTQVKALSLATDKDISSGTIQSLAREKTGGIKREARSSGKNARKVCEFEAQQEPVLSVFRTLITVNNPIESSRKKSHSKATSDYFPSSSAGPFDDGKYRRPGAGAPHSRETTQSKHGHGRIGTHEHKGERRQRSPELALGFQQPKRSKLSPHTTAGRSGSSSILLENSSSQVNCSHHCPQCQYKLPRPLPAVLKDYLRRVSTAVTPTGRALAIHELCASHTALSRTIPAGKAAGYPASLDIPLLIKRTRALVPKLRPILHRTAESHFRNLAVKNGGHGTKNGGSKLGKRRQGQEARMLATADIPAAGYYGPKGASAIASTLFDEFLAPSCGPPPLSSFEAAPLTPIEFLQDVLVPEAALLLIKEDLKEKGRTADQASALATLVESAAYGAALFPDDDDTSDGMDSGSDF